jgi:hypothetical protein
MEKNIKKSNTRKSKIQLILEVKKYAKRSSLMSFNNIIIHPFVVGKCGKFYPELLEMIEQLKQRESLK